MVGVWQDICYCFDDLDLKSIYCLVFQFYVVICVFEILVALDTTYVEILIKNILCYLFECTWKTIVVWIFFLKLAISGTNYMVVKVIYKIWKVEFEIESKGLKD